ncbi:MAG TPA: geranylgeranylglycerol-phosphate geranylgeranyltransferase [Bacteroidales bacterium]|jgi:4-hydroxybenzoate polyprenyltransferase|nr:UbiA family prenyltransferase [Bacteroidales bacterium]HNV96391.1 geranylgeranylglycerol-phosphate geranylgeranyltransferase [Bacteroidales bacterium]HOU97868.1 geranylgeranylglycerol-phosphate geranylgeranyltransferase [Bacteroidales bacterium]
MKITDIFKLIRYKNLLIIVFTMYAVRYGIIYPFLQSINYDLQLDELHFLLLVLATASIAAAGYAINDYFDIRSDIMNHPESVVVGTKIPRRSALTINNLFNFIGVALGFYISYYIHLTKLGLLFLVISGLLWFYSSYFKKMLLWGNIIVATFAALVPLLPVLFEIPLLNEIVGPKRPPVEAKTISIIFFFALGYSYFAFMLTLMREIIKDMEDVQGDMELNRNTLPLVIGIPKSKLFVYALALITILSIVFIYIIFFQDIASISYLTITILIPLAYLMYKLFLAKGQKEFYNISQQLKWVMFAGIMFLSFLWLLL